MTQDVHLLVEDTDGNSVLLDLYLNEKIYLNYEFNDIKDLAPAGNYSREFRIPASDTNIGFFGTIFNVNQNGWFDFRKKVPARISVETIPIIIGHIQVKKVYWSQGKVHELELTFFGEIPNLSKALGNKKLRDLTALPDLNFEFNYENVTGQPNDQTILTLCDKYNFTAYDASDGHQPLYSSLNSGDWGYKPLHPHQMTPAVNAKWIFEQIMGDANFGFTWNSINDCLSKNIFVPWLNSKDPNTNLGITEVACGFGLDADYTFGANFQSLQALTTSFWDYNGSVSGGIFTASYSGTFTFRVKAQGYTDTCTLEAFIGLRNITTNDWFNVTDGIMGWFGNSVYPAWVDCGGGNTFNLDIVTQIYMEAGDQLILVAGEWNADYCSAITLYGNTTDLITGVELLNASTTSVCNMVNNAPDMLQIDFIKSIQKMFNLAIVPDRNNINSVFIEPMVKYIASTDGGDWSNKLDINKDVLYYPTTDIQKAKFTFTYAQDGDYFNKIFQDAGRTFGNYEVNQFDFDVQNDFATGEEKVELTFASTPCNGITYTDVVCPRFLNDNGEFVTPKPRILYHFANFNVNMYDAGTSSVLWTNVKCLSNYSTMNADITDEDLNFAPEIPLHTIVANPYNNLYNRWWRNYYREIYDGQARIMEAYFSLKVSDILSFRFSDKVWIIDSYWRILSIEGYEVGGLESTKVKLIRVLDIDNLCNVNPVSVDRNYLINWEDDFGNPVTISEECCLRFGYFWNGDGEKGGCFAKPQGVTDGHEIIGNVSPQKSAFSMPIKTSGVAYSVRNVDSDTYLRSTDSIIFGDAGGGIIKLWLPHEQTCIGHEITIRNIDPVGTLRIQVQGGGLIEGATFLDLVGTSTANFVSNGSKYYFTGKS